jgi:hypothetical protein
VADEGSLNEIAEPSSWMCISSPPGPRIERLFFWRRITPRDTLWKAEILNLKSWDFSKKILPQESVNMYRFCIFLRFYERWRVLRYWKWGLFNNLECFEKWCRLNPHSICVYNIMLTVLSWPTRGHLTKSPNRRLESAYLHRRDPELSDFFSGNV